jgi:cell division GTPase FtsZ
MRDKGIKFGFVGCGQGGGKIVDLFAQKGYKAMAINTSPVDLAALTMIPNEYRLAIGSRLGAGKDPRVGQEAIRIDSEKVKKLMQEYFYHDVDFVFVSACLGGGTGTGVVADTIEIARQIGLTTGCITTIPLASESLEEHKNALKGLDILSDVSPTPLYLIDNELLRVRFGNKPIMGFWPMANEAIVNALDEVNQIPNRPSDMFVFDREDFFRLLNTPGCFSPLRIEVEISDSNDPTKLATLCRQEIVRMLTENNFQGESTRVAALLVCPESYRVNAESVELVYQECQNLTNTPTLFRGLYIDRSLQRKMILHLLLAGLEVPINRLQDMRNRLQELGPEIANRLNRRVSTNLGDDLMEWDASNPLPPLRRRSFGSDPRAAAPAGLPDVKSAASSADKRPPVNLPAQPKEVRNIDSNPQESPAPEKENPDTYKILTVDQILNLMETANTLSEEGKSKENKGFWNQFKSSINKKR